MEAESCYVLVTGVNRQGRPASLIDHVSHADMDTLFVI